MPKAENPGFWKGIGASASQGFGGNLGFGVSNLVTGGLGYAMGAAMSGKSNRGSESREPSNGSFSGIWEVLQNLIIQKERQQIQRKQSQVDSVQQPTNQSPERNSTSELKPEDPQALPWTAASPGSGDDHCKRQGWYDENGRFLAEEDDTTEWKTRQGLSLNWSHPVVEDCRWEGSPPFCGTADEYTGAVVDGWKLIIGDRIRQKAICKKHFSRYYSGQDCCLKFDAKNKCRRGYRRLWCKTKVRCEGP
ncbi:hypothetical protein CP532_5667 [Ophiocordyceps camponoti-leonardi (nom. inval.)]|nr:hypothetical protein CP532_5667 [Ophiocordyceps camponoti-leonardi (nom. inval.)]